LLKWAREEVDREQDLKALLTATDSDNLTRLETHAPLIWAAMNDERCVEPGCAGIGKRGHKSAHQIMSHRYQKPVVEYCVRANRWQNASQPGLGKTIETLATLVEADVTGMVLVAAPKTSLRTVWEPEVQRWLPGVPVFTTTGGRRRRMSILDQAIRAWASGEHSMVILVINPEMLRTQTMEECETPGCGWHRENHRNRTPDREPLEMKYPQHDDKAHKVIKWYEHEYPVLFEQQWAAFIVDETHRYTVKVNLRSNRSTQIGTGAMLIELEEDAMKGALSGTPWKGKPKNAWAVKHWLVGNVGLAASFWNWADRMMKVEDVTGRNGQVFGQRIGYIGDPDTFRSWCDGFMIRHTKAEMAPWLPPKTYAGSRLDPSDDTSPIGIWLEMDGKQETAYRTMEDDAVVQLDNGTLFGNGILAEMTRLKQFASSYGDLRDKLVKGEVIKSFIPKLPSNKFEWTLEFLAERGITGDADEDGDAKVVIASQFTQLMIDLMAKEYKARGIDCLQITGRQNDAARLQAVRRFQQPGGPRVVLLNTMAGGVSVTLDAADDLVFIDETFIPDDQEQVEDRTHRTSRIHNVTIYYVRSRNSIDERIARMTQAADDIQKMLLDGKRGVEFAKRLLGG
jgi:SNF2 family DNA or RNA helicase